MNIENIVLARKLSVLEYDAEKNAISFDEAIRRTRELGVDGEKILSSHLRQLESIQKVWDGLLQTFKDIEVGIINGDNIAESSLIKPNSLIIAAGGDNYFQLVSHFLTNQPLIGINSDPVGSNGALTYFTADSFIDFLPRLGNGNFNVEGWTRLAATINGKRIPTLATSEIYIGAYKSTDMSRYLLDGEEQKSSGLVVATGAGTTGWYSSVTRFMRQEPENYLKTHPKALVAVREPFGFGPQTFMYEADKLNLKWLAHGKGLLSIDARDEYELKRGDEVTIEVSDTPLRVVTP